MEGMSHHRQMDLNTLFFRDHLWLIENNLPSGYLIFLGAEMQHLYCYLTKLIRTGTLLLVHAIHCSGIISENMDCHSLDVIPKKPTGIVYYSKFQQADISF